MKELVKWRNQQDWVTSGGERKERIHLGKVHVGSTRPRGGGWGRRVVGMSRADWCCWGTAKDKHSVCRWLDIQCQC